MSENKLPRVVHLAAGQGTRLRPLTDDQPKPLVEFDGNSLLERNVKTLDSVGVSDHVVVTGYEANQIRELGLETVHNDVYNDTEMIYSLFCAVNAFPDSGEGDLIISYGDIIYEQHVAEALLDCNAPLCVVVDTEWRTLWETRFDDPLSDAEILNRDADNRILEIGGVPENYDDIDAQYIGLLKVSNDYLDEFIAAYEELDEQTDGFVSIDSTAFLQHLIDDGWYLQAVPVEGGWLEIDTLSDLRLYRTLLDRGELSRFGITSL